MNGASHKGENQPCHKPFEKYTLPSWCEHPLKVQENPQIALFFPGEHTNFPGMLAASRELPVVQEMLELATEAFDFDVERAMREGSADDNCHRIDRTQMLAYVAGCASYELLKEQRPEIAVEPLAVGGFDVGELAALVAAGCFDYDQGLIIVKARAEAMCSWAAALPMAAVAIYGLKEDEVQVLCYEAVEREQAEGSKGSEVYLSHLWGHLGVVCSGRASTVHFLHELVVQRSDPDVFASILEHCQVAAHTPMAAAVASELEEAILSIPLRPPRCQVLFNPGYRVVAGGDPAEVLQHMLAQLQSPLEWRSIVTAAVQIGANLFYECGPGQSLKELMAFNSRDEKECDVNVYAMTVNLEV